MSIPKVTKKAGTPGFSPIVRLVAAKDVTTFPLPAAGSREISADITFGASKGWAKIESTLNSVGVTYNYVGEMDSKSLEAVLTFRVPNTDLENLDLAESLKNEYILALVEQVDGTKLVLGNLNFPGVLDEAAGGAGVSNTDATGLVYTVKFFRAQVYTYTGDITDLA